MRAMSRRIRSASKPRLARRSVSASTRRPRRRSSRQAISPYFTISSPARSGSSPSTARASTSRRRAPTRSTQSSTAIWRPAGSASPARGRSPSPASRTRWADARSAASPTCSRRIWRSKIPSIGGSSGISGVRRRSPQRPGSRRSTSSARSRTARSRRSGSSAQIRPSPCRRPTGCARRSAPVRSSSSRTSAARPTRRRSPTCSCRARPGEKRTGRSPIPSGAFRASGPFCRRLAKRSPTGGSSARWRNAWASRRPSLTKDQREIFAEYARLTAEQNGGRRDLDLGALCRPRR